MGSGHEEQTLKLDKRRRYFNTYLDSIEHASSRPLAFVGLVSWIDAIARLYYGKNNGYNAWRHLIRSRFPEEMHDEKDINRLYRGFRCSLTHTLAPEGFFLVDSTPDMHWEMAEFGDYRIVNLQTIAADCRRALDAIFAEAETDEALRNRLLAYTPIEYVAITITDPRKHQRTGYTAWLGSWR